MLVIRLARTGKKKQAYFRVVVQEKQKSPGAKFVEILGNYDPHTKKLTIDSDKAEEYMKHGAQPSNTLAKLLKKEGVKLPKWVNILDRNRSPKAKKGEEDTKELKNKSTEGLKNKETEELKGESTEELKDKSTEEQKNKSKQSVSEAQSSTQRGAVATKSERDSKPSTSEKVLRNKDTKEPKDDTKEEEKK